MAEKILKFYDIKGDYKSILEKLKNNTLSEYYPMYKYMGNYFSYKLFNKDLSDSVVIFIEEIKVNIQSKDLKKNETFLAHSNLDIKNFCKKKLINMDELYLSDTQNYKNDNILNYLSFIKDKELNLFIKEKEKLPEISSKLLFILGEQYKVKEYSSFYKDYFEDENLNPDFVFKFDYNDVRKEIFNNILSMHNSNKLHTFKFTGPFNIGKSITLLEYCRTTHDSFYLNLKCLINKSIKDSYLMIQEEFARISSNEIFKKIQDIIIFNYSKSTDPLNLIIIIMKSLFEEEKENNFSFIFDQFKEDFFSYNQKKYLEEVKSNIKIVYCSSINENKIRIECLNTWNEFTYNPKILDVDNQKYYFYYVDIYSPSCFNENSIVENITNIKRFKKYTVNCMTQEEKLFKIKEHIIEKMEKFSSQIHISFDYMISYIKRIINKKYKNNELNEILELCPLKYFIIIFLENHSFLIRTQFALINQIINRKLLEEEVFNYFKYNKYKRKVITNKTIKGDYFEEAVIIGLKNILPNKYDYVLEVKEIISMQKIDSTSLDINYLKDDCEESEESEEEKNEEKEEENIYGENGKNEKENFIEDEMDVGSLDDHDSINLDELLKKFSIKYDKNKKNIETDNLETYRQNEIKRLKHIKGKKYEISKEYTGEETFLIRQKSKVGRVVDCAYITGEKNDKTFIGFQMKCYFEETNNLKKRAYDKDIIKKNLKQLLINSLYLLNCKITHWYYYLIFYLNKENAKYNVKDSILQKYKGIIEIVFYEPLEKEFYGCEKKKLTSLQLTDNSNLDIRKESVNRHVVKDEIDYQLSIQNKLDLTNSFIKDFDFIGEKDETNILKEISRIMEIQPKIIDSKFKTPINNDLIRYPNYDSLFLYKKRNNGFFGIKTIKKEKNQFEVVYYDLEKKKKINVNDFNKDVDLSFNYIYILKIRKRTHNDLQNDPYSFYNFPKQKTGKFDI